MNSSAHYMIELLVDAGFHVEHRQTDSRHVVHFHSSTKPGVAHSFERQATEAWTLNEALRNVFDAVGGATQLIDWADQLETHRQDNLNARHHEVGRWVA